MGKLVLKSRHRLKCGDSTNAEDVAHLMGGERAGLCFTSPPYAQQRDYDSGGIGDWDTLMRGVFSNLPMTPDGQVLVNLGLVHRDGEWMPYWDGWIEWMRSQGWRRFGWYVWDQMSGFPGDFGGRCAPSHEFIFHFNRESNGIIKHIATKESSRGTIRKSGSMTAEGWTEDGRKMRETGTEKIPDSVWRFHRQPDARIDHPAKFPVALAAHAIASWPGHVYEPMSGSGTTIIAAEQLHRRCFACEISPAYTDLAVRRFEAFTGEKAVRHG